MEKPLKINLREKEYLQLDSDIYIYGEGEGMCQDGAINLLQFGFGSKKSIVRFHKKDIPCIIKALQSKIPMMTEDNGDEFNKELNEIDSKFEN